MMLKPNDSEIPPDKYVTAPSTNNWTAIYTNFYFKSSIYFYNLFSYC